MTERSPSPSPEAVEASRRFLDGVTRVLGAQLLGPVAGLLVVAFLTRRLGPDGYGLLTLTLAVVRAVREPG
jgi:O-antigen/teichoic acid export membrane protein